MKKKLFTFLLFPLILTSCGEGPVSLTDMRAKIAGVSDENLYPYYHVVGSCDFNNMYVEIDEIFDREPGVNTFVPYSRYNDGFYNMTADISEPNPDNIIIYSLASKSYWLRAPLRINKSNFYSEIISIGNSFLNGHAININAESGSIGSITLFDDDREEKDFADAKISNVDENSLTISADFGKDEEKQTKTFIFTRQGEYDEELSYAGKYIDANDNELIINKGSRENTTCAHYLIEHIITSYVGQAGSTNPSKNKMKMDFTADGGYVFYAEASHTTLFLDNLPYYPDPVEHPEIGEWDEEFPTPCYKNKINAKFDIRLEYNAEGWLVKESFNSVGYDYNLAKSDQVAGVAYYGYRFS